MVAPLLHQSDFLLTLDVAKRVRPVFYAVEVEVQTLDPSSAVVVFEQEQHRQWPLCCIAIADLDTEGIGQHLGLAVNRSDVDQRIQHRYQGILAPQQSRDHARRTGRVVSEHKSERLFPA